jgi:hypothetical protein
LRVVARLVFEVAGEHCEGSRTLTATIRNCPKDRLQHALLGATEYSQVQVIELVHGVHSAKK